MFQTTNHYQQTSTNLAFSWISIISTNHLLLDAKIHDQIHAFAAVESQWHSPNCWLCVGQSEALPRQKRRFWTIETGNRLGFHHRNEIFNQPAYAFMIVSSFYHHFSSRLAMIIDSPDFNRIQPTIW